jgi:Tfp pilus assembly ATPase PilU
VRSHESELLQITDLLIARNKNSVAHIVVIPGPVEVPFNAKNAVAKLVVEP